MQSLPRLKPMKGMGWTPKVLQQGAQTPAERAICFSQTATLVYSETAGNRNRWSDGSCSDQEVFGANAFQRLAQQCGRRPVWVILLLKRAAAEHSEFGQGICYDLRKLTSSHSLSHSSGGAHPTVGRCCAPCRSNRERLRRLQLVRENIIVLSMKGSKDFPLCGFSGPCVSRLARLGD